MQCSVKPDGSEFTSIIVFTQTKETAFHKLCLKYPPAVAYRKLFFKCIINKVEAARGFVSEDLCNVYIALLSQKEEPFSYKSYYLPSLSDYLTLQESRNFVSGGTTGLVTWKGGMFLAEWCLHNEHILLNKNILELGCGCGFTGLAVAKSLDVASYTFTDAHPDVLRSLESNVAINRLDPVKCRVEHLSWDEPFDADKFKSDVLLAADVVFDPALIPPLVKTIAKLLQATPTCEAFVACTERNARTYGMFVDQLGESNLRHTEIETDGLPKIFFYGRDVKIHLIRIVLGR